MWIQKVCLYMNINNNISHIPDLEATNTRYNQLVLPLTPVNQGHKSLRLFDK